LKAKCAAAGGEFNTSGSEYSCYNAGKHTSVFCDAKGHCSGNVPGRQVPKGGLTGTIGGTAKAETLGVTRRGGSQATPGTPPKSAATIRRCLNHHC
jgi:hypothetical protein